MEGLGLIILVVVAILVLLPVAFIAYVNVGGSYRAIQYFSGARRVDKRVKISSRIACSIDADCPPGYVCANGHCVPSRS